MPGLTFAPQHERHLTLAAVGHCMEHYRLLREQAEGRLAPNLPGKSLLIGIGMDVGVGALWCYAWHPDHAVARAREELEVEHPGLADASGAWPEIEVGIRQYADQWGDGVRGWEMVALHPYLDPANHPRLTITLPSGRTYLCMPDAEVRIGGVLTIVDHKTSAFPYRAEDWAWEPQLLANTLAASRHYGESCQYLVDFMQRPSRYKKSGPPTWTFPLVHPFPFDDARRMAAENWLALGDQRLTFMDQLDERGTLDSFKDPAACRTWYGRCEFWERCWGQEQPEQDLTAALRASLKATTEEGINRGNE